MRSLAVALLFGLITGTCFASARPTGLDWPVIELEWKFIKQAVGAPANLPMPPIVVEELPPGARMIFQFPILPTDAYPMQISIAPSTLKNYGYEMLDWAVGHELTHYAFIMRENNWEYTRSQFVHDFNNKHHCNREYMAITKALADVVYSVYHGERERYAMWDEVQRSCAAHPNQ
jgi:hypothetical protein